MDVHVTTDAGTPSERVAIKHSGRAMRAPARGEREDAIDRASVAPNGAEAIFEVLRAWGIDRVFICPGSTEAAFLDVSLKYPEIKLVLTTHESISVGMADGYARATGKPGVVYVHTHLGLLNGLAHLYCAFLERSPVVVIAGVKAQNLQPAAGFTTTSDIRALPRQFVKSDWQSLTVEAVPHDLDRALRVATTIPLGPAFVAFSQDLLETQQDVVIPPGPTTDIVGRTRPDPSLVRAAAGHLVRARRPLILLGGTAAWPELSQAAVALAELTGAALALEDKRSIAAAGVRRSPRGFVGPLDNSVGALHDADLVLLAGARTPLRFEDSAADALPRCRKIHLIEDPRELNVRAPESVPLLGDARLGLQDLVDCCGQLLAGNQEPDTGGGPFGDQACNEYRQALRTYREAAAESSERTPIRVASLMEILAGLLPPGSVVVDDSVTSKGAVMKSILAPGRNLSYLTTAGGSLGWGMAAATGAAHALSDSPVVAVVGDGVFQFGMQALFTALRERLSVVYVVVNNRGYAAVKAALNRYDGGALESGVFPGADLSGIDIAATARGFGATAFTVDALPALPGVLAQALSHGGPVVIDVLTDINDYGC